MKHGFLFMATMLKLIGIQRQSMLRLWLAQVGDVGKRHIIWFGLGEKSWHKLSHSNGPTAVTGDFAMSWPCESPSLLWESSDQRTDEPNLNFKVFTQWSMDTEVSFSLVARGYQDHGLHATLVSPCREGDVIEWEMARRCMKCWCVTLCSVWFRRNSFKKQISCSFWFHPIWSDLKRGRLRFLRGWQNSKLVSGHSQVSVQPEHEMPWMSSKLLPLNLKPWLLCIASKCFFALGPELIKKTLQHPGSPDWSQHDVWTA